jgi:phosphoribosylamine--glycine ligase/phosphoribosylformylglycinamidine cyclo-ligase
MGVISTGPKVSNNGSVKSDDYPGFVVLAQLHKANLVVP